MKKFIVLILLIAFLVVAIYGAVNFFGKEEGSQPDIFKKDEYKEYKAGEYITFSDSKWYVLYDSNKTEEDVTLISADILNLEEEQLDTVLSGIYESSDLNKYLKNEYAKSLGEEKLVEKNGYKVRLFNKDDLDNLLDVTYNEKKDEYEINNCPDYICLTNAYYSTMIDTNEKVEFENVYLNVSDIEDPLYDDYELHLRYYNITTTYETFKLNSIVDNTNLLIRPVINVYKSYLE